MSRSDEMFFSAARPRTASTISRDMALVSRDQVGAGDVLVGDRDHPVARGNRHVALRGPHELASDTLVVIARLAQPHACAATEKARVVGRLGQRPVLTR